MFPEDNLTQSGRRTRTRLELRTERRGVYNPRYGHARLCRHVLRPPIGRRVHISDGPGERGAGSDRRRPAGENPSFLAVDNEQHVLCAVNEVEDFDGNPGGVVRAFSIDRSTGALRFLGVRSSRAAGHCHLSMDVGGNWVFVAN